MRGALSLVAAPVVLALLTAPAVADPFGDDWPAGPGREFTGALCGGCHSLALVKQQRLSRARWDELLDWMIEEQGMPDIDAGQRAEVLDYLSAHFGDGS